MAIMESWEKPIRDLISNAHEVHGVHEKADFPDDIPPNEPVVDLQLGNLLVKTPGGEIQKFDLEKFFDEGPDGVLED